MCNTLFSMVCNFTKQFNTILAHLVSQHFADIFIPTFQKSTCLLHIPFSKLMIQV